MALEDVSKSRQAAILTAVTVIGCVVLYALAEAGVRVRHYIKYGGLWGIEDTYVKDAESGLRIPKPNGRFGNISINSRGFRGPEIAVPKPADTIRIAFLGASTTYSAEVSSNEAAWPHLVVAGLRQRWPDKSFDYVNAGVPGYTASTSLENLRRRVAPLEPDVIVVYHGTNDLSSNSYDMASAQGVVQQRSEQKLSAFSNYSLLWYLLEKNLMVAASQSQSQATVGKIAFDGAALEKQFEGDLQALLQESRSVAPVVFVATFSTQMRADQTPERLRDAAVTSLFYMPYMTLDNLLEGFAGYNRVITETARNTGVDLIADENAIPGDTEHFKDSVHFTDAGSRAMAERVLNTMTASPAMAAFVERRSP